MDVMNITPEITYIVIAVEIVILAVLLFFVAKLSREYKRWKAEESDAAKRQKDRELDKALANERRR